MAYSDYGGYAYKNGQRVEDRSDAVLSPDGIKSTPGAWPGWTIPEGRGGNCFHVLLGDGPIFIGLYKQSHFEIWRLGEQLEPLDLLETREPDAVSTYDGKEYLNTNYFLRAEKPCVFVVDGHRITFNWVEDDNYCQYAKVEQPDGSVWTGFSGYGVGAGLEDAGYGFSTGDCESRLEGFFPIKQRA